MNHASYRGAGSIPTGDAPVAPSVDRPSFVPWIGDHQGTLLDSLDRSITGAIASSLPGAPRNAAALRRARRELGLGVLFDLEAWRIQLPTKHAKRQGAWADLGLNTKTVYRPDEQAVDEAAAMRRAASALDAQTGNVDPTIFTTAAHWLAASQTGRGRENDLLIATATVELFHDRALAEPRAGDDFARRRRLFASLLVDLRAATSEDIRWLIEAYSALDVDGFVVWVVNFNRGLGQGRAADELLQGLQARSGRPVVAAGLSHWHVVELSIGIAATCSGPQRGDYRLPPGEPPQVPEGEDPPGRGVHTYFGPALGCFGLMEQDEPRRRRGFMRHPCPCGSHPRSAPPATAEEIKAHNAWWLRREAADAQRGSRSELARRVPQARQVRRSLGMGGLNACWSFVAEPGQRSATG